MRKTVIILSVLALTVGSCKNHSKNTTEQEMYDSIPIFEEYSDSVEIQLKNRSEVEIDTVNYTQFKSKYSFATFSTEIFTGKLANPDFTGLEMIKDDVIHINEVCNEEGINFGGHYTIVHFTCGCMCQGICIVDRISGKIFHQRGIEKNEYGESGKWGFLYKPNSKLLIANSELFTSFDSLTHYCNRWGSVPELYVWNNEKFKRIQ